MIQRTTEISKQSESLQEVNDVIASIAAQQSKQIANTIKTIRSGITELDGDSEVTDQAFATVRERISGLAALETQIKSAMDEQGEGSRSTSRSSITRTPSRPP